MMEPVDVAVDSDEVVEPRRADVTELDSVEDKMFVDEDTTVVEEEPIVEVENAAVEEDRVV